MRREKTVSVRFAAVGGDATKAEMRSVGQAGKDAMQGIAGSTAPASAGLDNVSVAAQRARDQLEAIAAKAAASAAQLRNNAAAATDMQARINRATGVSTPSGMSAAQILQQGQALDDLRAKYNPTFAVMRRYRQEVAEIRAANLEQAISEDEKAAAISRARKAALADIAVIKGRTTSLGRMGTATRNVNHRMQMMSFQLNDIGVSLAGGMNPFMVMAQQGTQIAQIYGNGGGGVAGALRDVGSMMRRLVTANPYVTAAVIATGVAIAGMTYEINQAQDVTVGFGDTALAVFQVIGQGIATWVKPAVDAIAPWFRAAWDTVVAGVKWLGNSLINGVKIAVDGIRTAVGTIPDMFNAAWEGAKAAVFDALTGMVVGIESFLSKVATGLNDTFGTSFSGPNMGGLYSELSGRATEADMARSAAEGRIAGAWEGFANRSAKTWNEDPMGDFYEAVKRQAIKNAKNRNDKDTGNTGGKSEKDEVDDLIKALQQELAVLRETDPIKKKMLEYSEKLADATAEEKKHVLDLVVELDRAKNGWESVGIKLSEYAEDAKRIGKDIGGALTDAFSSAEDALVDFAKTGKLSFRDMVNSLISDLLRLTIRSSITGPIAGLLGSALGGGGAGGTGQTIASGFKSLMNFEGGGHTGNAPRSGGLDGRGGFLAMVHPRERWVDETKGGSGGQAGRLEVSLSPDLEARWMAKSGAQSMRLTRAAAAEQRTAFGSVLSTYQERGV